MVNQISNAYQNQLSPAAWNLVKGEVASAGQSLVNKYPNVGSSASPTAKSTGSKDVEAAIDDLLKSL
jgi:hypothetical protein